ncbi:Uncharacterized protein C16orf52-like protein B [Trichoplax sp. H2]|nr:Uncharacterized protein C16orf52-like protein B [Trichoplax sp. H2]|eukprot:RDD36069.1 Uncharacterized protein C16orf52-like protein B [Trichoplax sp. H2]
MEKTHIAAIVSLILAVALNIASLVDQEWIYISTPVIIFCSATLLFPVGFHIPAIRGQPYRLPSNAYIGRCFPLFIAANFLTFVGTLLAHRTICQMFSYDQSDQQLV